MKSRKSMIVESVMGLFGSALSRVSDNLLMFLGRYPEKELNFSFHNLTEIDYWLHVLAFLRDLIYITVIVSKLLFHMSPPFIFLLYYSLKQYDLVLLKYCHVFLILHQYLVILIELSFVMIFSDIFILSFHHKWQKSWFSRNDKILMQNNQNMTHTATSCSIKEKKRRKYMK